LASARDKQFTYTVSDGKLTATGTVTLRINSIYHPPSSPPRRSVQDGRYAISGIAFYGTYDDYCDV
jgi:hypothetical protein